MAEFRNRRLVSNDNELRLPRLFVPALENTQINGLRTRAGSAIPINMVSIFPSLEYLSQYVDVQVLEQPDLRA